MLELTTMSRMKSPLLTIQTTILQIKTVPGISKCLPEATFNWSLKHFVWNPVFNPVVVTMTGCKCMMEELQALVPLLQNFVGNLSPILSSQQETKCSFNGNPSIPVYTKDTKDSKFLSYQRKVSIQYVSIETDNILKLYG